jgi:hypothetical protein
VFVASSLSPERSARSLVGVLAGAGLCVCAAGPAYAQTVDCRTLPNAVHGIGGSAATPFIRAIAKALAAAGDPTTVVYADTGACDAMTWLVINPNQGLTKDAKYWDASTGAEATCNYPSGSGTPQIADWGAMAQEATTCGGVSSKPAALGDFIGPISGFSIIAPTASNNYAITAEALYFIYGFGPESGFDVKPWTKAASVASRSTTSAAGILLAKAAGIPTSRPLFGSNITGRPQQNVQNNQGAINYVTTEPSAVADPDSAIGFCSTETVESGDNRSKVRTLAFQAKDQHVAYFPDSSDTASDKKNLREGRYFLWNPHHFFARVNASGGYVNENAGKLVDYLTGKQPLPGDKAFLDVVIDTNVIPQCAMHVTRDGDMGPLASFQPDEPCGCYFDEKKGFDHGCTRCSADDGEEDAACPTEAPVCRHGFCEVK